MEKINVTVVGLGLIGASICKALKNNDKYIINGIDLNKAVVKNAKKQGLIQSSGLQCIGDSQIIILCLYPKTCIEFVRKNVHLFKADALITDVSGVKDMIVDAVEGLLKEKHLFIPGHPMAGREEGGFMNAVENLFTDANYLIVTSGFEKDQRIQWLKALIIDLRAKIVEIPLEKHDEMIALTSQLPHVIASAMTRINTFKDTKDFVGNSFDDMTRISLINESLWSELFIQNKKHLKNFLLKMSHEIHEFIDIIEREDMEACQQLLLETRRKREDYLKS